MVFDRSLTQGPKLGDDMDERGQGYCGLALWQMNAAFVMLTGFAFPVHANPLEIARAVIFGLFFGLWGIVGFYGFTVAAGPAGYVGGVSTVLWVGLRCTYCM